MTSGFTPNLHRDGSSWVLRLDPPASGTTNMAIDRTLLRELDGSRAFRTILRFYSWNGPTVSIGKHQEPAQAVNMLKCAELGVPVVQRPTGGRAVYHDDELTYSLLSNDPRYFQLRDLQSTYRSIAHALQKGLRSLGIPAEIARGYRRATTSVRLSKPCFVAPSRYELLCGGRKVVGSAQRRLRGAFLQQGSIPIDIDYAQMARVLSVSEQLLRTTVISTSEGAGQRTSRRDLEDALAAGFRNDFDIEFQLSGTASERGINQRSES